MGGDAPLSMGVGEEADPDGPACKKVDRAQPAASPNRPSQPEHNPSTQPARLKAPAITGRPSTAAAPDDSKVNISPKKRF